MPPDDLSAARAWYYSVRFRTNDPVPHWPAQFIIVTGWATTGVEWSDAENAKANLRLEMALRASGTWFVAIEGYSVENQHAEPGFAVELSPEEGTALGRHYLQDAIYVIRDDRLTVRYCEDEREEDVSGVFRSLLDKG